MNNELSIFEIFRHLHAHPELALHEFATTAYIRDRLLEIPGVEIIPWQLKTGVAARLRGKAPGPVIALRADIDALPLEEQSGLSYSSQSRGRMHACGHDFHTAALIGAIRELAEQQGRLHGTVVFIFQPAEEAEHGGQLTVETGILEAEGVERILALHVKPQLQMGIIAIAPGPFSSNVDRFSYTVTGRGAHGSAPQLGLDPIPAVARLITYLNEIVSRQVSALDQAVLSVTHIESGSTWNIIPESAFIEGTVRSFTPSVRNSIIELMGKGANALEALGYRVNFEFIRGCPATNNDSKLSAYIKKKALEQKLRVIDQIPAMGGEDFSCFQQHVPGALFNIGVGGEYPVHNPHFKADERALPIAVSMLSILVLDYFKEDL